MSLIPRQKLKFGLWNLGYLEVQRALVGSGSWSCQANCMQSNQRIVVTLGTATGKTSLPTSVSMGLSCACSLGLAWSVDCPDNWLSLCKQEYWLQSPSLPGCGCEMVYLTNESQKAKCNSREQKCQQTNKKTPSQPPAELACPWKARFQGMALVGNGMYFPNCSGSCWPALHYSFEKALTSFPLRVCELALLLHNYCMYQFLHFVKL